MKGLGSIVILKKRDGSSFEQKLVIVDRFLLENKDSKNYYQYKGIPYPYGNIDKGKGVLFCDSDILHLVHEGYRDSTDIQFCEEIQKQFEKLGIKQAN